MKCRIISFIWFFCIRFRFQSFYILYSNYDILLFLYFALPCLTFVNEYFSLLNCLFKKLSGNFHANIIIRFTSTAQFQVAFFRHLVALVNGARATPIYRYTKIMYLLLCSNNVAKCRKKPHMFKQKQSKIIV